MGSVILTRPDAKNIEPDRARVVYALPQITQKSNKNGHKMHIRMLPASILCRRGRLGWPRIPALLGRF